MARTVKVRIAVVIDKNGKWNSCGWDAADEEELIGIALDPMELSVAQYWITAEIPVPDDVEIPGTVEPAGGPHA